MRRGGTRDPDSRRDPGLAADRAGENIPAPPDSASSFTPPGMRRIADGVSAEDSYRMGGWATQGSQELPRFDLSVSGLAPMDPDLLASSEYELVDMTGEDEPTLIADRSQIPREALRGAPHAPPVRILPALPPPPREFIAPPVPIAIQYKQHPPSLREADEVARPVAEAPIVPEALENGAGPAPPAQAAAPRASEEAFGPHERTPLSGSILNRTAKLPRVETSDLPSSARPTPRNVAPAVPGWARRTLMVARVNRLAVALGALSVVIAVGLAVWMSRPERGELRVAVAAPQGPLSRAEIFVDGEKKCEAVPCLVTGLAVGPRSVQVIAPGFAPTTISEVVEPGKERLALVSLMSPQAPPPPPSSPPPAAAAPPAAPPSGGTELVASSVTPGVRARIDGADRGPLPLRVSDLSPGKHRVRFEADRFEPLERIVQVDAGRVLDLGEVKLRLLKGRARLELGEPGAVVTVQRADGGKPDIVRGPWPASLDLDAGHTWRIVARKPGYRDFSEEVSFSDAVTEKTIAIALASVSGAPAVARGPAPPIEKREPAQPEEPREAKPAAGGMGTLNINSLPASKVLVDGVPVGNTPKVDFPVSAGVHTVTFIHPELGKKTVTVTVTAGQSSVAAVKLKPAE
jgi:hypothetical protein